MLRVLLGDPTVHKSSLKKYLRAVLAIQHGLLKGSIPVKTVTGRLESDEEGHVQKYLSKCTAEELAHHIRHLLRVKRRSGTKTSKPAAGRGTQ
ncbi:unnamed protein product [Discosporangium mesarthrocarpum]